MKTRHFFLTIILFVFLFSGCALISDQPSGGSQQDSDTPSKELGLACFAEGDLSCAGKNYCEIKGDAEAGLRCCLAKFLKAYFSENTQALGEMLGYQPASFSEIRKLKRHEIVDSKAVPFGEVFLLSREDGPKPIELGGQWLKSLFQKDVSTEELRKHLGKFGSDLQGSFQCLGSVLSGFGEDEVQPEIFSSEGGTRITRRDLFFIRAVLGAQAYLIQGISEYEWGFESFGQLSSFEDFLANLNGQAGAEDDRLGDLSDSGAARIAGRLALLVQSFDALKSFSSLQGEPSRIDTYLNWRFSKEAQEDASAVLKAAYQSLKKGEWVPIPNDSHQINLFSLVQAKTVPKGNEIPREIVILFKNERGGLSLNWYFVREFFSTVLREP